jgi:uncharacterized OsmC-like protein
VQDIATNQWVAGTHNKATVKDFYGALQEDSSREAMVITIDEPPVRCGRNLGGNPVEYLLDALSGCLTTSMIAHAARGIEVRKVESRYEGDLDREHRNLIFPVYFDLMSRYPSIFLENAREIHLH